MAQKKIPRPKNSAAKATPNSRKHLLELDIIVSNSMNKIIEFLKFPLSINCHKNAKHLRCRNLINIKDIFFNLVGSGGLYFHVTDLFMRSSKVVQLYSSWSSATIYTKNNELPTLLRGTFFIEMKSNLLEMLIRF